MSPWFQVISEEAMRTLCFLIFLVAGLFFSGIFIDNDVFRTYVPWVLAVSIGLAYFPVGVLLRVRLERELKHGGTPPGWLHVWSTSALSETVRAMALLGLVIFLLAPILYPLIGPYGTMIVVAMGWILALCYIPFGTWFRERGASVGVITKQGLRKLVIGQILIIAALVVTSVGRGAASWLEAVVGALAATLVVVGTLVWGRGQLR